MKHPIHIALLALLLAGCNNDRAKPEGAFANASQPAIKADTTTCSPFPEGVSFDFPYRIESDYYHLNVMKMIRHRVVLEYTQGTSESIQQNLKDSMLLAGFTVHDIRPVKDNQIHARFHKKGYGMAHVFLKPKDGADASLIKGTLTFDLPPPQFNPPAAVLKEQAKAQAQAKADAKAKAQLQAQKPSE